jgi:hypothetical protein
VEVANFQVLPFGDGSGGVALPTRLLWDFMCLGFLIDYDLAGRGSAGIRSALIPTFSRLGQIKSSVVIDLL